MAKEKSKGQEAIVDEKAFEAALASAADSDLLAGDDPVAAERKEIEKAIAHGEIEDVVGYGAEAIGRFESKSAKITASMLAMQHKRWDLAEALVDAFPQEASRRAPLHDWHPLHYAAAGAPASLIGKILKIDPSATEAENSHGLTPLGSAASRGHLEAIEALLKAGASVEGSPKGNRPIGLAAAGNRIEAIEALAKAGADVNAKGPEGKTPMMMAAAANCSEAIGSLAALGADKALLDNFGKMALDIAVAERNKEAQKALGGGKAEKKPKAEKPAAAKKPAAKPKAPAKKPAAKPKAPAKKKAAEAEQAKPEVSEEKPKPRKPGAKR